jgi:zinc protease
MSEADFQLTRNFLRKYVLHFAPTTMERLGYALDDRFYGIDGGGHLEKYRKMMDEITLEEVNAAIRKHWQFGNLRIAIITNNAESLKASMVSDASSPITYTAPKPPEVLEEDKHIIDFKLNIKAEDVKVVPVAGLFGK